MPIRKNKKRIDPRYFLNETTYRDLEEQDANRGIPLASDTPILWHIPGERPSHITRSQLPTFLEDVAKWLQQIVKAQPGKYAAQVGAGTMPNPQKRGERIAIREVTVVGPDGGIILSIPRGRIAAANPSGSGANAKKGLRPPGTPYEQGGPQVLSPEDAEKLVNHLNQAMAAAASGAQGAQPQ